MAGEGNQQGSGEESQAVQQEELSSAAAPDDADFEAGLEAGLHKAFHDIEAEAEAEEDEDEELEFEDVDLETAPKKPQVDEALRMNKKPTVRMSTDEADESQSTELNCHTPQSETPADRSNRKRSIEDERFQTSKKARTEEYESETEEDATEDSDAPTQTEYNGMLGVFEIDFEALKLNFTELEPSDGVPFQREILLADITGVKRSAPEDPTTVVRLVTEISKHDFQFDDENAARWSDGLVDTVIHVATTIFVTKVPVSSMSFEEERSPTRPPDKVRPAPAECPSEYDMIATINSPDPFKYIVNDRIKGYLAYWNADRGYSNANRYKLIERTKLVVAGNQKRRLTVAPDNAKRAKGVNPVFIDYSEGEDEEKEAAMLALINQSKEAVAQRNTYATISQAEQNEDYEQFHPDRPAEKKSDIKARKRAEKKVAEKAAKDAIKEAAKQAAKAAKEAAKEAKGTAKKAAKEAVKKSG